MFHAKSSPARSRVPLRRPGGDLDWLGARPLELGAEVRTYLRHHSAGINLHPAGSGLEVPDKQRCTSCGRLGARSSSLGGGDGNLPGPRANFQTSRSRIARHAIANGDSVLKLRAENPNPGAVSS